MFGDGELVETVYGDGRQTGLTCATMKNDGL